MKLDEFKKMVDELNVPGEEYDNLYELACQFECRDDMTAAGEYLTRRGLVIGQITGPDVYECDDEYKPITASIRPGAKKELFTKTISDLLARDPSARPFVCDGSPLECVVFIVGTNPATKMERSFKAFWDPDGGFNKSAWLDEYERLREEEGKRRRSPSRNIIEKIVGAAPGVGYLETNVFSTPTANEAELKGLPAMQSLQDRVDELMRAPRRLSTKRDAALGPGNAAFFEFLVDLIRPRVMIVHGSTACREVSKVLNLVSALEPAWEANRAVIHDGLLLIPVPHFSRGWSYDRATALGMRVASLLQRG